MRRITEWTMWRRGVAGPVLGWRSHRARILVPLVAVVAALTSCTYTSGTVLHVEPDRAGVPVAPQMFGMTIHRSGGDLWPSVPTTAVRLWDTGTSWRDLQPTRNTWNWTSLDEQVARANSHGARVLLTLGITPQWASSRPTERSDYGPGGAAEPRDLRDYARYVVAVAARYRGRIAAYEVWNEPMVPNYYTGTPAKMASITHVAYDAVKSEDRLAAVISPAPFPAPQTVPWLDAYLKTGVAKFFDIVGVHIYKSQPEQLLPAYESMRQVYARYGVKQPIWDTETGYRATWKIPASQWRGYVARTYLLAAAGGISRLYWYAWNNLDWVSVPMVAADRTTLTAAGVAFGETYRWLVGATVTGCSGADFGQGLWQCKLLRNGRPSLAMWHPTRPTVVAAPPGTTGIRTLSGSVRPARAGDRVLVGVEPLEFLLR